MAVARAEKPDEPGAVAAAPAGELREWLRDTAIRTYRGENAGILIAAMVVIIGIFAILLRHTAFLSVDNFLGIVRQTAVISIMAIATVFVISAGEIDLSIAAVIPLAGYWAGLLMPKYGMAFGVFVALAFGAGVGLVNGLITVLLRVPSFVVTLGTMGLLQGLAMVPTNSQAIVVDHPTFDSWFGGGDVGPVPGLAIWTLAATLVGYLVLAWTPAGKAVLATGANPNAARFSGIRTNLVKVSVMMASGTAGALGGLLYVGQYQGARYDLGSSDLLTVIAAAIIGGTALTGGKGSVIGAVVGSLLLGAVNNGLIIEGLNVPEQLMFRGGIIIAAVVLSARAARRRT